ncbi:MAG: recombinase family protein [Candidatus Eisenbacteria bacterium]
MKRAALYLRRSTNRQPQSVEDQRKACLQYAAANGFDVVREYEDSKSGTNSRNRKRFLQMIDDAESPGCPYSYILVYDVSRFGRVDNDEAGYYRHLLYQHGTEVVYVKENFNGDDTDDLVRPVKQWQAHDKAIGLSLDTIRGQISRAEKGRWNGGMPPDGLDLQYFDPTGRPYMRMRFVANGDGHWKKEIYDNDGKLDRTLPEGERISVPKSDYCGLVPGHPGRIAVVQHAFRMYGVEEMGYRRIADKLNSEGLLGPRGGRWTTGAVRNMLTNPLHKGAMVWNRTSLAKIHRIGGREAKRLPKSERGRHRRNGIEEWIIKEGTHEAIVDPELFDLVQRKIKERSETHTAGVFRSGRARKSPYLLTGLMRCLRCGRHFQGYTCSRRGRGGTTKKVKTMYYVCNGYVNSGNSVCPRVSFRKDQIEERVLAMVGAKVNAILANGGRAKLRSLLARSVKEDRPDPSGEIKEIKKGLRDVGQTKKRLIASLTAKNKEFLDEEFIELARRKNELEARLQELESMKHKEVDIDATVDAIMASVRRFKDLFSHGTLEEKKAFLRLFIDRVELDPDKRAGKVFVKRLPVPKDGAMEPLLVFVSGARYEPPTFGLQNK